MCLPIFAGLELQFAAQLVDVADISDNGKVQFLLLIHTADLRQTNVWKVLWPCAHEAPAVGRQRSQFKLMAQIRIFLLQAQEILVVQSRFAFLTVHAIRVQQTGLSHKESFSLKQTVAMLGDGLKRNPSCPALKGIPVQSETEVAGQCDEESLFPVAVLLLEALQHQFRPCLQSFVDQGAHPAVHHKSAQITDDFVAARIIVRSFQNLVLPECFFWYGQLQLRHRFSGSSSHRRVCPFCDMKNHIIVGSVLVVSVLKPFRGMTVHFHIAHPGCISYLYFGIEEVRSGICVLNARIDYLHFFPFIGT